MLIKISRQDCLKMYPKLPTKVYDTDKDNDIYFYPEAYSYEILTVARNTFRGRITMLGVEISKIVKKTGCNNLIFLGDDSIPWLYRDSDYKPAKLALDYLLENKVGKKFNGALRVDGLQIPAFVRHLAWLTRCNTLLPYVYFTDPKHNIIGSICQYGNLHISILNIKTAQILQTYFENSKLEQLNAEHCT